jgi:hypothetical protein
MRRLISLICAFSSVVLGIGVFEVSAQRTKRSAEWAPDAVILKQLGAAVPVEKYTLRLPKEYEEAQKPENAPPGVSAWAWTGAARRDGTKPSITLLLLTLPAAQQEKIKNLPLDELADRMIGGVKKNRTNWKQAKLEKGVINGVNFARIRWEGTEPKQNWEMRGFVYVARDGDTIVQIASQDIKPETEKALPITEASALTFKRK